jgi:hypothetical protein
VYIHIYNEFHDSEVIWNDNQDSIFTQGKPKGKISK